MIGQPTRLFLGHYVSQAGAFRAGAAVVPVAALALISFRVPYRTGRGLLRIGVAARRVAGGCFL